MAVKPTFIGDPVVTFDKRLIKHFYYASDDRVVALQCLAVGVHCDDKQVFPVARVAVVVMNAASAKSTSNNNALY